MNTRILMSLFIALLLPVSGLTQEERWDVLTVGEMGVDRFREAYPDFDGSGVVVAVMDTGVDMGVEGLKVLPDGSVKVVDCRDFTGEGDLFWEEGRLVPDGGKGEKLVDSKGRALKGFQKFVEVADPQRFYMAFLQESEFSDSTARDMNGDGDSKDSFGILIFSKREKTEAKEEEGGEEKAEEKEKPKKEAKEALRFWAVVDVNGDGSLEDGVFLTDYWREHQTFTLKGKKGDRKRLTMALNFHPEEKRLNVHFDDGGHGTHVAGIAAGYRIHGQEGYHGMAPGARVLSLKIGNNRFAGGSTVTESVKKALDFGVRYAKDHKVPVVFNMSYSIGSEREGTSAIDKYVDDILWKNPQVLFVTSAGNEGPGLSTIGTPAAATRAITVGALLGPKAAAAQYGCSLDKEVAFSFSSRGGDTYKPDIMAPGSASSTVPPWGDRDHMNGTSMSSPAAAGAIAILVDGLVRHDPPLKVDNALALRAVKNTGRHLKGLTVLDEGGGALDLPAAYEYAKFLYGQKEEELLREYRVKNMGPSPGVGAAYFRSSPALPRGIRANNFTVSAGFPDNLTKEKKARFYRAFDLTPDQEWISLTKPMIYLKGGTSASVGLFADVTGMAPGLYTGRVKATRKSEDRFSGAPIHEFDIVMSVLVPLRVTPENRGRMHTTGELEPGFFDRAYVEVPPGIEAITMELRMIEGGKASWVSASLFDPDGVQRGGSGSVSEQGSTESRRTVYKVAPGTWEVVVSSSIRSRARASYDLIVTLSGVKFGDAAFFAANGGMTKDRLLVPLRSTQAFGFRGTITGRLDGVFRRRVIEVEDTDTFTHTVRLDNTYSMAKWTVEFDRDTYALFTDCVLRVEDGATGKTLRNSGLNWKSESVNVSIPGKQADPKDYKLVLMPAFTKKGDTKKWRFVLTEELTWGGGPMKMEVVSPKGGRLSLQPWETASVEFRFPAKVPAAPEGYELNGVFEAVGGGPTALHFMSPFRM